MSFLLSVTGNFAVDNDVYELTKRVEFRILDYEIVR